MRIFRGARLLRVFSPLSVEVLVNVGFGLRIVQEVILADVVLPKDSRALPSADFISRFVDGKSLTLYELGRDQYNRTYVRAMVEEQRPDGSFHAVELNKAIQDLMRGLEKRLSSIPPNK